MSSLSLLFKKSSFETAVCNVHYLTIGAFHQLIHLLFFVSDLMTRFRRKQPSGHVSIIVQKVGVEKSDQGTSHGQV